MLVVKPNISHWHGTHLLLQELLQAASSSHELLSPRVVNTCRLTGSDVSNSKDDLVSAHTMLIQVRC